MKLIGPFSQILPLIDLPLKGPLSDEQLLIHAQAGILVADGLIWDIGRWETLLAEHQGDVEEVTGESVLLPGFVDCHTHICFGGSRHRDYAMRIAGKSYLEIAKAGGGIWDTVTKTREASLGELSEGMRKRAKHLLANGVTTCEVKSGYGLTVEDELKMLRAIQRIDREETIDLIPTCLAAHMKPRDFAGSASEYLAMIAADLLPKIQTEKLAGRVDIFIEESAFTPEEATVYLTKAKKMGFELTIHGDQFTTGGSEVGIQLGARSVEHLEASTGREIRMIAASETVGTALPGASIGLGCDFTKARMLLDAGGCLAISSDWNPGSAPMGDLLTQAAILSVYEKLTSAETWAGMTLRAAHALGLQDRGRLMQGMVADMQAYPTSDFRQILYHQGQLKPNAVWKNGQKVVTHA